MRYNLFFCLICFLQLCACTHTINFRSNHFATPIAGSKQWGGHLAMVGTGITKVTLIDDVTTNPPTRTHVKINSDTNITDALMTNYLSIDASLSVWKGVDVFLEGPNLGIRYQFLNAGTEKQVWVGAIHASQGNPEISVEKTESNDSRIDTKSSVNSQQTGLSIGYKFEQIAPYFSFIREDHRVSTTVQNTSGSFGPFKDSGQHHYYTLGLTSYEPGINYAFEASLIDIYWKTAQHSQQWSSAFKLGYQW